MCKTRFRLVLSLYTVFRIPIPSEVFVYLVVVIVVVAVAIVTVAPVQRNGDEKNRILYVRACRMCVFYNIITL